MVAGDKRRSAVNIEIKTLDYLVNICLVSENTRDSCLIALLFLSGRRLGEILHLKKSDIKVTNDFMSFETFNEKCFRKEKQGNYSILIKDRYYEKINVSFSVTSEAYRNLGQFITTHLESIKDNDHIFERFRGEGHIGRSMAYCVVKFLCPDVWPHWFRHQRFSMVTEQLKDLPTADLIYSLKDFTKHHRTDSTLAYVHRMRNIAIQKT